jgi:hypothetical protein
MRQSLLVALGLLPVAHNYFAPVRPCVFAGPRAVRLIRPLVAIEADESFRLLGLGEDATYDEIEAAVGDLTAKYAGDAKMKIKLQVAKDKIMDERLKQRMSGRLAAPKDPFDVPEPPKPLLSIPPAFQGFMELPTSEYAMKNAVVFAVIGMLPVLSRSWASTSVSVGFAAGLWKLYNRGLPGGTNSMEAEFRPPKPKPVAMAVGITLLAGAVGATLSQLVYGLVRRVVAQEVVIGLFTSLGFYVSSTLCARALAVKPRIFPELVCLPSPYLGSVVHLAHSACPFARFTTASRCKTISGASVCTLSRRGRLHYIPRSPSLLAHTTRRDADAVRGCVARRRGRARQ